MSLTDVGIRLVVEGSESFNRQVNQGNQSVQTLERSLTNITDSINQKFNPATIMMGTALGQYLVRGIDMVVSKIEGLVSGSLDAASRFDQLRQIAYMLAMQQGMTAQAVDKTITTIRNYGIEASIAADLVVQFARNQLDLAKATQLARVAQDAAQITGANSSETLQRLLWGIQTYNTETFRTAGIQLNASQSFDIYAKSLNKTAESLTSTERSQAILNGVLKEGEKIAGTYETSLGTAAKIWTSYTRVANDLQVALGTPFLEASKSAGLALTDFTKAMTGAFSEGGKLYPLLENVGAAFGAFFSILKDGSKEAANQVIQFFSGDMFTRLSSVLSSASQWGFNLISSFAIGISEGITSVLAFAIQQVGNILAFFLEAHSPPKIAPDIDKWGANTLTAWLNGFKDADYSALNGVQNVLRSALSGLGLTGASLESAWRGLSGGVMQALAGQGGDIVGQIRSQLGIYGDSIAKLVGLQLQLAAATNEVDKAEAQLAADRKAQQQAQTAMSKIVDEYNLMARTEKDPAKLEAKRKEFLLARETLYTSNAKVKADQTAVDKAKEALPVLEKQVKLQQQLVQTLIEMTKQQTATGGAKGLSGLSDSLSKLGAGFSNVNTTVASLQKKIEEFKQKLIDIFKPIQDSWNQHVSPNLKLMEEGINKILELLVRMGVLTKTTTGGGLRKYGGESTGEESQPQTTYALAGWTKPISDAVLQVGKLVGMFWLVSTVVSKIGVALAALGKIGFGGGLLAALTLLYAAFQENWFGIRDIVAEVVPVIKEWIDSNLLPVFKTVWEWIDANLVPIFKSVWETLQQAAAQAIPIVGAFITDTLLPALAGLWDWLGKYIVPIFQEVGKIIGDLAEFVFPALVEVFNTLILPVLTALWNLLKDYVVPFLGSLATVVAETVTLALKGLDLLLNGVIIPTLKVLWGWFKDNILPILGDVANFVNGALKSAFSLLTTILNDLKTPIDNVIKWFDQAIKDVEKFLGLQKQATGTSGDQTKAYSELGTSIGDVAKSQATYNALVTNGSKVLGPLVGVTRDLWTEMGELGLSTDTATLSHYDYLDVLALLDQPTRDYIGKLLGMDGQQRLAAASTDTYRDMVGKLAAAIAALKDKTVTVTVDTVTSTNGVKTNKDQPADPTDETRHWVKSGYWTTNEYGEPIYEDTSHWEYYAKGGRFGPGLGSIIVGENGPEILTRGEGGYITPNNALMDALNTLGMRVTPAMGSNMLAATGQNYSTNNKNYNLTLVTQQSARTVRQGFDAMRLLGG